VCPMPKADVLDRISADLARGHTQPAIQRLSSLVAAHPTDLELRWRLARLHRMVGNRIEAGRWDYLTPGADGEELAAFERAFPWPSRRLAALRWPYRASLAATGYARARLEALIRAATGEPGSTSKGRSRLWVPRLRAPRLRARRLRAPRRLLGRAGLGAAGLVGAFFVVLGAVTVAQWLLV
jgi:hypothetical protein